MPENDPSVPPVGDPAAEPTRVLLSRAVCDRIKTTFPEATYEQAIVWLLDRSKDTVGDPADCALTELWFKLHRLEEVLSLLALTNVDIADVYRRQVAGELGRLRDASVRLAETAQAHQKGEVR
jgi:hypothetical protein